MTAVIGQDPGDLLGHSDERDLYMARIGQAYRDGWLAGQQHGYRGGRADESRERDQAWNRIARQAHAHGTPYAEVERRRWTLRGEPRTAETFADPHPGDYQGRGGAA